MSLFGMMGTSISGMAAQANRLSTVADNIANADTTGYKEATTEFSTLLGNDTAANYESGGVLTTVRYGIAQQGNLGTGSAVTNLAIKGSGFFVVQDSAGDISLTRAGSFVPDASGNLINTAGYYLMGYPAGSSASAANTQSGLEIVNAKEGELQASASTSATFAANLPSTATAVAAASLPSTNSATATYTDKTSIVTYTDLGQAVTLDTYVTKTADSTWEVATYNQADAAAGGGFPYAAGPLATQTLTFDPTTGKLAAGSATSMAVPIPGGDTVQMDLGQMTQYATGYTVATATANGNAPSALDHVEIGTDGTLTAVYANGTSVASYRIPLATVASPDNLTPVTGNVYEPNSDSGDILIGNADAGGLGNIDSSTLEASTVDIATELTTMIQAQRGYEANSKVLQTGSDLMSVINNLKTEPAIAVPFADEPQRMSLSSALSIAQSALAATATQTSVVSRNIAGVNTSGYSEKTANVVALFGGSQIASITRAANQALLRHMLAAQSDAASQQALSNGLEQLQQTVGDTSDAQSPAALIGSLSDALQTYSGSPSDTSAASAVVASAKTLAQALNSASSTVQQVRGQADADMAGTVSDINSLLAQFQSVNTAIVNGTSAGADVTDELDARDQILSKLSQDVGITTTTDKNNGVAIYTDSGVTLFQGTARSVTFAATNTYAAATAGSAVYVDGVPVTGSSAVMAIKSGTLAGLADLRDNVATQYQGQLDEIARGLIDAFAESDQTSGGTQPTAPGLFTYSGAPAMPGGGVDTGLAADIAINANVDPDQGGNVMLLRDGGISNPTNAAYTYNTTGAASYTGRISQLLDSLGATRAFNGSASADTSDSLSGYATASVSWLEASRQDASSQLDYKNAAVSQTTTALSNATGVNLDDEMSKMLDLEHSYEASSKLINSVGTMYDALLQAFG